MAIRVGHPFFSKERSVLCVLFRSFEKNGKERNILLGLISHQKLEKRTEKNVMFSFETGKERNVLNAKERGAQPCCQCLHLFTVPNTETHMSLLTC